MKILRNLTLGAAAAAVFGVGAAAAQETAKPAAKPETAHRHAGHPGHHGQHGQQGCEHRTGEKHEHPSQEKDEKHEHAPR